MMMLEQFTVENFKAFKSLELKDLGHINIFVGDNNVGKTCLLQALALSSFLAYSSSEDTSIMKKKILSEGLSILQSSILNLFYKQDHEVEIKLKRVFHDDDPNGEEPDSWDINSLESVLFSNEYLFSYEEDDYSRFRSNPEINLAILSACIEEKDLNQWSYYNTSVLPHCIASFLYFPTQTNYKQLATENFKYFSDEEEEKEEKIIKRLQTIESRLKSIRYTTNSELRIGLANIPKRLPLESMGDGFTKLLGLACCLEQNNARHLCIDEPENGFHYKTQTSFWKLLANWSLEGDKQSFIATHSYELISCLNDLLTADPTLLERELKVRVHQLKRDETDSEKITVKTINEEGLDWLLAHEMEIR